MTTETKETKQKKPKVQTRDKLFKREDILGLFYAEITEILKKKDLFKEINNKIEKQFKEPNDKLKKSITKQADAQKKISSSLGLIDESLMDFSRRLESLEESLLFILHNIKKNQFLYAHYPEDWVKDYLSVKKGVKAENEFMDKQIKNLG